MEACAESTKSKAKARGAQERGFPRAGPACDDRQPRPKLCGETGEHLAFAVAFGEVCEGKGHGEPEYKSPRTSEDIRGLEFKMMGVDLPDFDAVFWRDIHWI